MKNEKLYNMIFADLYLSYINKAERKNRTKEEVIEIIYWLFGYDENTLFKLLDNKITVREFFEEIPNLNEDVNLIKGSICGYKIEDIEDPLMKKIRYLDKLIDELAKGKSTYKIINRKKTI